MITSKNWWRNSKLRSLLPRRDRSPADVILLILVLVLVLFGLLMVYSSSFIYAHERTGDGFAFIRRQLVFCGLGLGVLYWVSWIPYRFWLKHSPWIVGLLGALLILVLIPGIGNLVGGARRWIHLGLFGFQPAEIAKFVVILFVARQLDRKRGQLDRVSTGVFAQLLVPIPLLTLLLLQPDFGSFVMISVVIFLMMFVGGVRFRFLASLMLMAASLGLLLIYSSPYRLARFSAFVDPWKDPSGKGFQIIQSLLGLHNGNLFGVGLGNGKEKLFFLPEAHNDFIFAVIGEEMGFLGIVGVVGAFLYFVLRGLRISWNSYRLHGDQFGMLLAAGITLILGLQAFVNIGVVFGILPTKGLTLPFISYGGSALLMNLFCVGVLLSISRGPRTARY